MREKERNNGERYSETQTDKQTGRERLWGGKQESMKNKRESDVSVWVAEGVK